MQQATTGFDEYSAEQLERLEERLTTLGYKSLTDEEQILLRELLRRGAFAGYPKQVWIGQGGPSRPGDLDIPAFSTSPTRQLPKRGVIQWLKVLFSR